MMIMSSNSIDSTDKSLLRIRAVTAFVSLSHDDFQIVSSQAASSSSSKTTEDEDEEDWGERYMNGNAYAKILKAKRTLNIVESALKASGYEVQTVRIATNAFGEYLAIPSSSSPSSSPPSQQQDVLKLQLSELNSTLAHLFSCAIIESCSNVIPEEYNNNNTNTTPHNKKEEEESMNNQNGVSRKEQQNSSHPRYIIEPLHFMRRWKKIQQLRSKYNHFNDVNKTKTPTKKSHHQQQQQQQQQQQRVFFPPYILERTDVWCDESNIHVTLAVILNHSDTMVKENEFTITSMQKSLLEYLENITTSIMKNSNEVLLQIANAVLQSKIRALLSSLNAVSFIANGSIMPRKSGASLAPMSVPPAIPFYAPSNGSNLTKDVRVDMGKLAKYVKNQNVSICKNEIIVSGMIIPKGITLIVGGGYHGKSTMLRTIMAGVYNKTFGDGRELCVTDENAITVRAEDGRYVHNTNVSAFISNLPIVGSDTRHFSTREASGSTSQAANVVDAIEMGASAILIDEDVSAANFMSRDGRMVSRHLLFSQFTYFFSCCFISSFFLEASLVLSSHLLFYAHNIPKCVACSYHG